MAVNQNVYIARFWSLTAAIRAKKDCASDIVFAKNRLKKGLDFINCVLLLFFLSVDIKQFPFLIIFWLYHNQNAGPINASADQWRVARRLPLPAAFQVAYSILKYTRVIMSGCSFPVSPAARSRRMCDCRGHCESPCRLCRTPGQLPGLWLAARFR